jgi:hypothetical protein
MRRARRRRPRGVTPEAHTDADGPFHSRRVDNPRCWRYFAPLFAEKGYGTLTPVPIDLYSQLQRRLERIAERKGQDLGDIVINHLTKEVESLEKLT